MSAVDHEGRIFGRLNLIDAALLALAVVLIPAGYAAYWLFRAPEPAIHSFEPASFSAGDEVRRVTIRGRYLRPFLRVVVGGRQAQYLLRTAEEAQAVLPPLGPGTYDVVLFDEAREVARHEGAIIVREVPALEIHSFEPASFSADEEIRRVTIRGRYLRPFLRVVVGGRQAQYLLRTAEEAQAVLPPLGPGTYDVVLFDEAREVARHEGAIIVREVPAPEIYSFEPTSFSAGNEVQRVTMRGRYLRPSVRVFVGGRQVEYLLRTAEEAQAVLPPLGPGTYDVALFDETREVARYEGAITIKRIVVPRPPATTAVRITGAFSGLTADQAAALYMNRPLLQRLVAEWSEILAVGPPETDTIEPRGFITIWNPIRERFRLPAVLRVQCQVRGQELSLLSSRGVALAEDPELKLTSEERAILKVIVTPSDELAVPVPLDIPSSGALGLSYLTFLIEEVFPGETTPLAVKVRIPTRPEVLAVVRRSLAERSSDLAGLNAWLLSVEEEPRTVSGGSASQTAAIVSLRVPAVRTPRGWVYRNIELKRGAEFTVSGADYRLTGEILSVEPEQRAQ